MELRLVTYPDEFLRRRSEEVTEFGPKLKELADAMLSSLETFRGVGLSAVQIGKLIRLFVVDTRREGEAGVFVNPQIAGTSQDNVPYEEGCLSVPNAYSVVMRPSRVTVQAFDVWGKPFTIHASGLFARAIQHEMDHLDGKLFVDHLDQEERRRALRECKRSMRKSAARNGHDENGMKKKSGR